MHKPGHKQKYSNRPSVSDLPKREESKRKDIQNLTLRGSAGTVQKFLSESDKADVFEGKWRHMDKYRRENLWQQWQKSGKPSVTAWSQKEFKKSGMVMPEQSWRPGTGRAFYSPIKNRMTIREGAVEDFFAELAHAAQWGAEDKSKRSSLWDKFKAPWQRMAYGEKVYDMPSHIEYQAHREIQPKMEKEYISSSPLYGAEESKPNPLNIRK